MYPKIIKVETIQPFILKIEFDNKKIKQYNLETQLDKKRFEIIKNNGLFNNYTIDPGGYGVSFHDEIDISEYELYNNGVEVE